VRAKIKIIHIDFIGLKYSNILTKVKIFY